MDKHTFLTEYNMNEEDLLAAEISWEELALIEAEYRKLEGTMRELGKSFIDEYLYDIEKAGIHSYRYRTNQGRHAAFGKGNPEEEGKPGKIRAAGSHQFLQVCDGPDRHPGVLPVPGGLEALPSLSDQPV